MTDERDRGGDARYRGEGGESVGRHRCAREETCEEVTEWPMNVEVGGVLDVSALDGTEVVLDDAHGDLNDKQRRAMRRLARRLDGRWRTRAGWRARPRASRLRHALRRRGGRPPDR